MPNLQDEIIKLLHGIDYTDSDSSNDEKGWWETQEGADFGARKLKELLDLVKRYQL